MFSRLPVRLRVIVSAYLGCAAAAAVAAVVAGAFSLGDRTGTGLADACRFAGRLWLQMHAGPFTALFSPLGFLVDPTPLRWAVWIALVVFDAACILAHSLRPHRRTAVVTTLGMVLWFFLAAVLGLWYAA